MVKVAVSTSSFGVNDPEPQNILTWAGFEIALNPLKRTLNEEEVISLAENCVGLIAGTERLSAEVLRSLPQLRVISRCGSGLDNIDLPAACSLDISVFNTPDAPVRGVVELVLGLALDLARYITRQNNELRSGVWTKRMGSLLAEKKMGIIGLGRIGNQVARVFKSLGCEVAYHDPLVSSDEFAAMALEELLQWSDCVTLHCSGRGELLLDAQRLSLLKPSAWVINTARGGLIDEKALFEALTGSRLAGAALDVFQQEPYTGPLSQLDQVILTPHIGSYARGVRLEMERQAAQNLVRGLKLSRGEADGHG